MYGLETDARTLRTSLIYTATFESGMILAHKTTVAGLEECFARLSYQEESPTLTDQSYSRRRFSRRVNGEVVSVGFLWLVPAPYSRMEQGEKEFDL